MNPPNIIKNRELKGDILVLGPLAVGGMFLLYTSLPYINNLLDMLQTAMLRGFAIAALGSVALALGSNWKSILRLARVGSRAVTRMFVAIDPIGYMEEIYSDVMDRFKDVQEKSASLRGIIESLLDEVEDMVKNLDLTKRRAQVTKDINQAQILGRDLERRENTLAATRKKLDKLEKFSKVLDKAREICELKMQDLTSQLDDAKLNQRINKKTAGIVDDLRSIMNPGNDDLQWNDAVIQIESDWNETRAGMDIFMEDYQKVIANHEIDGAIAFARIEELRVKAGKPSITSQVRISNTAASSTTNQDVENEEVSIGLDTSRIKVLR